MSNTLEFGSTAVGAPGSIARNRLVKLYQTPDVSVFEPNQLETIAAFCKRQNSAFMRERWLGYIAGTNGKNGGKV